MNEQTEHESYDVFMMQLQEATITYLKSGRDQTDLLMATTDYLAFAVLAQTRNLDELDRIAVQHAIIHRQLNLINNWENKRPPFDDVLKTTDNHPVH